MTAVYAGQASGGGTTGTADRSASVTPAIGELLVVFCCVGNNSNTAPTCSDDQGGTYALIGSPGQFTATNTFTHSAFVRNQPVEAAVAHSITVASGANDAGVVGVIRVSGMSRFGSSAVRQSSTANGANGVAPAMTFSSSALTGNVTIVSVGSTDTTTTPNASWTERIEANQLTPTTALEVATRDSGFTGTTVTAGATQTGAWSCIGVELDCSALSFSGLYPATASAMALAVGYGTWSHGYLMNESSGNAAPAFGSGNLTATTVDYSNTGMLPGETAIGFDDNSGDKLEHSSITSIDGADLAAIFVVKFNARNSPRSVAHQRNASQWGWALRDSGSTLDFVLSGNGFGTETAQVSYTGSLEWAIVLVTYEVATTRQRVVLYAPSVGFVGSANTAAATPSGATGTFTIGFEISGSINGSCDMDVDAAFLATGSSAASSVPANAMKALASFVAAIQNAPALAGDGRPRPRMSSPEPIDMRMLSRLRAQASNRPRDLRLLSRSHAPDGYGLGETRSGVGQGYLTDVETRGAFAPYTERVADMGRMRPRPIAEVHRVRRPLSIPSQAVAIVTGEVGVFQSPDPVDDAGGTVTGTINVVLVGDHTNVNIAVAWQPNPYSGGMVDTFLAGFTSSGWIPIGGDVYIASYYGAVKGAGVYAIQFQYGPINLNPARQVQLAVTAAYSDQVASFTLNPGTSTIEVD